MDYPEPRIREFCVKYKGDLYPFPITSKLLKRFWSKVDILGPEECWEWVACRKIWGYGQLGVTINKKIHFPVNTHCLSLWMAEGQRLDKFVLHKCDNPPCVNPSHLYYGSPKDNTRDMMSKGRRRYSRTITQETVDAIRREYKSYSHDANTRLLAKKYNLSPTSISDIVNFRSHTLPSHLFVLPS